MNTLDGANCSVYYVYMANLSSNIKVGLSREILVKLEEIGKNVSLKKTAVARFCIYHSFRHNIPELYAREFRDHELCNRILAEVYYTLKKEKVDTDVNIRITDTQDDTIKRFAGIYGITRSEIVRYAIVRALRDEKVLYDNIDSLKSYDHFEIKDITEEEIYKLFPDLNKQMELNLENIKEA